MVKLSYLGNYLIFKTSPFGYILTTLLIHLINLFLLFILLYKINKKILVPALITLLYGSSSLYGEVTLWSAGRPDSILLFFFLCIFLFFVKEKKLALKDNIIMFLLVLFALGTKETFLIFPFLLTAFLIIIRNFSFQESFKKIFPLWCAFSFYVVIFLLIPLINKTAASSYFTSSIKDMVSKAAFTLYRYIGLSDYYHGYLWQILLIFLVFLVLLFFILRLKNKLALFGFCWMVITFIPSIPIYYAASRYNYLPLIGFWIMLTAFLNQLLALMLPRLKKKYFMRVGIGLAAAVIIVINGIMIYWETRDYQELGYRRKEITSMYRLVEARISRDKPVVFINEGKKMVVYDVNKYLKGYQKLIFARKNAVWQLIYFDVLTNFMHDSAGVLMVKAKKEDIALILKDDYTLVQFTDSGFNILPKENANLINSYYSFYRRLPENIMVYNFKSRLGQDIL